MKPDIMLSLAPTTDSPLPWCLHEPKHICYVGCDSDRADLRSEAQIISKYGMTNHCRWLGHCTCIIKECKISELICTAPLGHDKGKHNHCSTNADNNVRRTVAIKSSPMWCCSFCPAPAKRTMTTEYLRNGQAGFTDVLAVMNICETCLAAITGKEADG